MDKHDEKRMFALLDLLPGDELDEILLYVGKKAIVSLLFSEKQLAELKRLENEGLDEEALELIDFEVAEKIDSLQPTNHRFLDFFDDWIHELFEYCFPDGSMNVILGTSKHDRWLAELMAHEGTELALNRSFTEMPPFKPDDYHLFLVEWRQRLQKALEKTSL